MIVYLDQKQFDDPEQKESHWVRNGLLTTGALVGAHFGAKAGLFGRHAQKFAGNMHSRMGNALGVSSMVTSGRRSAGEAVAKMKYGVTGRGEEAWNKAFQSGAFKDLKTANGKAVTNAGQARAAAMGNAMKDSKNVVQMDKTLAANTRVDNMMNGLSNSGNIVKNANGGETLSGIGLEKLGAKKGMEREDFVKAINQNGNDKLKSMITAPPKQ